MNETAVARVGVPADTSDEAHELQTSIYRRCGGAQRLQIALRLSSMTRELATAGIRGRHPDYSDDQVRRAYMRLAHGDDVARLIWPGEPLVQP